MSLLSVNKKGKWVVGGVIAFALIATASTGLAAWVIGMQTGDNETGNITVDTQVVDQSIDVTLGECELNIHFGPDSINNPLVNADSQETADLVDLDFTIAGTATWGTNVNVRGINVDVIYPQEVLSSAYIAIPKDATDATVDDDNDTDTVEVASKRYYIAVTGENRTAHFSQTYSFTWTINPCEVYTQSTQVQDAKDAIAELAKYNNKEYKVFVSADFESVQ